MYGIRLKNLIIACIICLGVSITPATRAHSDHPQAHPTSDKHHNDPEPLLRLNKTGKDFEVVVVVPTGQSVWTLYVSDTNSNRPIVDASISILLEGDHKIDVPKSDQAGIYQGLIPLKSLTSLSIVIKKDNIEESFIFKGVKLSAPQEKFPLRILGLVLAFLTIVGIGVFRKRLRSLFCFSVYVAILQSSTVSLAHGDTPHPHPKEERNRKETANHSQQSESLLITKTTNELIVPKELQFQLGMITERAAEREMMGTVSLVGRVISDPSGYARIQSSQNARVLNDPEYPLPLTGQKVQKDQVILALQPTLGKIESSDQRTMLYKIESEIVQLRNDVYRKEQLGQYASKKELENARTDLERAIRQKEEIINKTFKPEYLKSPLEGIVADVHVRPGEVVSPERTIVEVVDPTKLLVEAFVFDAHIADNLTGGIARLPLIPNKSIRLKLIGVSPKVSKEDQSIHVLFKAEELDPSIKLDMAIEVLGSLKTNEPTLTVPKKAVVENAKGSWVFVHSAPEVFEARRVRVRRIIEDWAEIEEGLVAGDRVVVEGAYLLNQARE